MAAQEPRQGHPAAGPQAETIQCRIGIFRAAWQMPAAKADQRRQRVAVERDEATPEQARRVAEIVRKRRQLIPSAFDRHPEVAAKRPSKHAAAAPRPSPFEARLARTSG